MNAAAPKSRVQVNVTKLEGVVYDSKVHANCPSLSASCTFSGSPSNMKVGSAVIAPSNQKLAVESESFEVNKSVLGPVSLKWSAVEGEVPAHLTFETRRLDRKNEKPELLEIRVHLNSGNLQQEKHLWHGVAYLLVFAADLEKGPISLKLPVKRPQYFQQWIPEGKERVYLDNVAHISLQIKLVESSSTEASISSNSSSKQIAFTGDEKQIIEKIEKNERRALRYFQRRLKQRKMAPLSPFVCVHPDEEEHSSCTLGCSFENMKRNLFSFFVRLCTGMEPRKEVPRKRSGASTISTKSSLSLSES